MERIVGTTVRGLRAPIIKKGDDLVEIVPQLIERFLKQEQVEVGQKDVVAITESIVARAQGNYVSVETIAKEVSRKFPVKDLGIVFPILSRNRFAILLRAFAMSDVEHLILMLSFPSDEVGNHLIDPLQLDLHRIDIWHDELTEEQFREFFGYQKHSFTGIDYVEYYKEIIQEQGKKVTVLFSNRPETILKHTPHVLNCDIHTRKRTKSLLLEKGATICYSMDDLLNEPLDGSGFHPEFGLLGSNKATENSVKLFPRDCMDLVSQIQQRLLEKTGKTIEVMVYGDGAFKDPVGKIWELADPVVSPGYTQGLEGTPNEIKLKYLADNQFKDLAGEELKAAIARSIQKKASDLVGSMDTQGTTPRRITDLLGSLCDLTSGSGDKGTPVIYIQGYFDNFID